MSILDRLRARLVQRSGDGSSAIDGDSVSFSAELPAGAFGSLLKIDVHVHSEPHGDGERLRMRAHVQSNFASVLRPMLADAPPAVPPAAALSASRALAPVQAIGRVASRGMRRVFAAPLVQRLAEPLLRNDLNTWIDLTTSTASLDRGAHDLVPRSEKLDALGIRPAQRSGPHAETWSGATPTGSAQVSMLQLDKDSLPEGLKKRLGPQPFNLAAVIINTVEGK